MVINKCGNINFPKPIGSDETWAQRPNICFLGRVGDIWIIDYSATRCDANNKANKDEPNSMKQH
jgi:hypothetical protein